MLILHMGAINIKQQFHSSKFNMSILHYLYTRYGYVYAVPIHPELEVHPFITA